MIKYFCLALVLLLAAPAQSTECNRNGGSSTSFEGTCDSRNYTWTDQCDVEEKGGQCVTTANSCGCQVIEEDGAFSSGIGSGSKGCANACVTISNDVPLNRTCQASGSGFSFEGSCDSRNYTYTSNCDFAETVDDQNNVTECMITANSCGCLFWEDDSEFVTGVDSDGRKQCDACADHGYSPSSAARFTFKVALVMMASSVSMLW